MGNLGIVYRNWVDETATVFAGSSAAVNADFARENLKIWDPRESYRTASLSPGYVFATFGGGIITSRPFDVIAAVAHNCTKGQNLLRFTDDIEAAPWTATNLQNAINDGGSHPATEGNRWFLEEPTEGSPAIHRLHQVWTKAESEALQLTVSGWAGWTAFGSRNIRVELRGASDSDFARINLDIGNQSINSSASGGGFSGLTVEKTGEATVNGQPWMKFRLTATTDAAASVTARFALLDGSFAMSYTGTVGNHANMAGVALSLGSTTPDFFETGSENGAIYEAESGNGVWIPYGQSGSVTSGKKHAALSGNLSQWSSLHSYHVFPQRQHRAVAALTFFAPNNPDAVLDIGRMVVGPLWRPSNHNPDAAEFEPLTKAQRIARSSGSDYTVAERDTPLRWRVAIPHITKDEAYKDMHDLIKRLHGTTKPALILLDPEANEQALTLYGWVQDLRVIYKFSDTLGGMFWNLSFTVEEFI